MSQEGFSLSATLKGGKDFDAPWVVVYANDPGELKAKLAGIAEQGVLQATVEAANLLKGANNAAPLLAGGQPQQQAPLPVGSSFGGGDQANAPTQPPAPPQQSAWGQQPVQQQNPANGGPANGQPHPQGRACGQCSTVLQYKSGTSKAGNPYRMWACPNGRAKGDGHESEFIR